MLLYDLRLALLSFRRNPALTALMVSAIAVGIGAAMVMVSIYHAFSGNPIWWKNDQLYAVAIDNKNIDPKMNGNDPHPDYPLTRLTYRDAHALFESDIPKRKIMMYQSTRILDPRSGGPKASRVSVRLTTADFFAMFDVPFLYGSGWNQRADASPEPVVVLSKPINNKTFNGENSVGRTLRLNGRDYRVIGVLDTWEPFPRFYDPSGGSVAAPEDLYLPLRWGEVLELFGSIKCFTGPPVKNFRSLIDGECVFMQFWAELPSADQRAHFRQFIDAYVIDQKKQGRLQRPLNNRLANVSDWLVMNDSANAEVRMFVILALLFLIVCVLNTLGMMLAKALGAAPFSALRRALGASRGDILRQHLTESMLIGVAGGLLGLLLTLLGLRGVRTMYAAAFEGQGLADIRSFTRLDADMVLVALGLSLLAGFVGGFYPAWRVCRLPPTVSLKY